MDDGKDLIKNLTVNASCKYVGMKTVSVTVFALNYLSNFLIEEDCIDVNKHRDTIATIQKASGTILIAFAGPTLKVKLNRLLS